MRVTSLRRRAGGWGVSVVLDTGERFLVDDRRLLELPLRAGMAIDASAHDRLERWRRLDGAEQRALRLLAIRARSRAELEQRLGHAGLGAGEVGEVIERLVAAGLVDDRAAAAAVAAWQRRRGAGIRRVEAALQRFGIEAEIAAEAVRADGGEGESARAARLARDRFGDPPWTPGDRARVARHLAGRGFDPDTVEEIAGDP